MIASRTPALQTLPRRIHSRPPFTSRNTRLGMIRRTLAMHFARASRRPAPAPKPVAAAAPFAPPPPRTAAEPAKAASLRNGLDGRIASKSHVGNGAGKSASTAPPIPVPVKASNYEFVDELTDNTGMGLAFGTVIVTLSALFGAHVVHSILKPDLVRNLACISSRHISPPRPPDRYLDSQCARVYFFLHSDWQTIPDMENEVFERKRKLKEAERNLTFGQASAR